MSAVSKLTRVQCVELYRGVLKDNDAVTMRRLCLEDLFFLLLIACKRKDMNHDWVYEKIRMVEAEPDGCLDLWAREHYKSSIITFGKTIQDILNDPEITVGIFSHTRPISKAFLAQIKREFEQNAFLQGLFPDILWENPNSAITKWSLDDGIIVKRKNNPKEGTVEAYGLVDGQPTSRHYGIMVYDDVVTKESVSSPEMIRKVTDAFSLSLNLGSKECRRRIIGTRYHSSDTYQTIIERESAKPRIFPGTEDGTMKGKPVYLSPEVMAKKLRDMGSYIFSSQILQNPLADKAMGFDRDWLMFYNDLTNSAKWNFYILVDAAGEKKEASDYTSMAVIGMASDLNYYLVDGVRDKMNLTQRTKKLFDLVRKWQPKNVGYEKYGMMSDIEHIKYVQEQEGYRFRIEQLGGAQPKNDRIRRLVPIIENHRFYLPHKLIFITVDGKVQDYVKLFIEEEYETFPVSKHDDMLDSISRIVDVDLQAVFPKKDRDLPVGMPKKSKEYDLLSLNRF